MEKLFLEEFKEFVDIYNIYDFPYEKYSTFRKVYKKRGKNNIWYYNFPCAFDIETTTIKKLDLKNPYEKDGSEKFRGEAFMYHWQFCLYDTVCFGRTWQDFVYFWKKLKKVYQLNETTKLCVYVHNLSYEFQFIKDFMPISSVFAKEAHKIMKCESNGIEFRCSYFLSNMSLSKFCQNTEGVKHYKLIDIYDYSKIRTPYTPLTRTEKSYCYCDVKSICEAVTTLLKEDTIATIPLTNTGYVRREYRHSMKTKKLRNDFPKLALSLNQYRLAKAAFRGGNTHANRIFANKIIGVGIVDNNGKQIAREGNYIDGKLKKGKSNIVKSIKAGKIFSKDLSSSYPAAIMYGYYPMGKFIDVTLDTQEKLDNYTQNYCCIMEIEFFDLKIKKNVPIPYIDIAHCQKLPKEGRKNDNGRILKAPYIKYTCTEIDLEIIRKQYDYSELNVTKAMYAKRGKLPDELRNKLLYFFEQKSLLKGIDEKEYEYMKSKNRLNSTFGMMVTDILQSDVIYNFNTHEWTKEANENRSDKELSALLEKYYSSKNSFLHFQWGVYVTAHARKFLQDMIDIVAMDVVYIDTDSIKFINESHIAEFDRMNVYKIHLAEDNDIPALCRLPSGKIMYMGTWDSDGEYLYFKTLGAKKYCYIKLDKNGSPKFEVTVSGLNKTDGAKAVMHPSNFEIEFQCDENLSGRTATWFNESQPHEITVNNFKFFTASNVGILPSTYTFGITTEYLEVINEANLEFLFSA